MTDKVETIGPQDPKVHGQVQGFQQVLQVMERDVAGLKERQISQEGIRTGAMAVAAQVQGMMAPIQKAVAADTMDPEEAKLRRDTIMGAMAVAEEVAAKAEREAILLKGEARGLARQVQSIRKLHQGVLDGERRKAEMEADQAEGRSMRSGPIGSGKSDGQQADQPKVTAKPKAKSKAGKGARTASKGSKAKGKAKTPAKGSKASRAATATKAAGS